MTNNMPPAARRKIVENLICPMTLKLPLDPVMTEDGRVYEREAIELLIQSNRDRELRSPTTGERMDTHLITALQAKNIIKTLIENEVIIGEVAEEWKKRFYGS